MKKLLTVLMFLLVVFTLIGCTSADRVSQNLSRQAEEFRVLRRIAAINAFTDQPVFELIGYCSIQTSESKAAGMMELTCKVDINDYTKHFIYMGDNVNIVVEQLVGIDVPQYHYQMIFAPQAILPIPEIITDWVGE